MSKATTKNCNYTTKGSTKQRKQDAQNQTMSLKEEAAHTKKMHHPGSVK